PFGRAEYVGKFRMLAEGILSPDEIDRFLDVAQRLPELSPAELGGLTVTPMTPVPAAPKGLF
ncbi:MAG: MmgE/PrpD family protein, partial [Microbacteriaceae bacterium]|nr:MmgE/PrpD family protein [Microbacteriaceae bacterium]